MVKSRVALFLGACVMSAPLAWGQTGPATLPASLPALPTTATAPAATRPVVADLTTPVKALQSFLRAYKAGDSAAIAKCISFKDPKDAEIFTILLEPQIAQQVLARAAEAKFGRDADDRFHIQEMEKDLDEKIQLVETLEVHVKDATATICAKEPVASQPTTTTAPATTAAATTAPATTAAATEPGDEHEAPESFGPVHLEKVGDNWKIQGSDFVRKIEPAELKSIEAFSAASVKLCREVMAQIDAGTLKSYAELTAKLEKGMEEIVGKALDPDTGATTEAATAPATAPATMPATMPATAPAK